MEKALSIKMTESSSHTKRIIDLWQDALVWVPLRERWRLWVLCVGHVAAVIAETGGAGLVYFYFSVALKPDMIKDNSNLSSFFKSVGLAGDQEVMVFMTFIVMAIFVFRTVLLLWIRWFSLSLVLRLERQVIPRLFDFYIQSNLLNHQMREKSYITNNITINASTAITHCTLGTFEILSALVLVMGFSIMLSIAQPMIVLIAIGILSSLLFFYWIIFSTKVASWGVLTVKMSRQMFHLLNEAFPSFKAVKVFKLEDSFSERFRETVYKQTALNRVNLILREVPRFFLELLVIVSILSLMAVFFIKGGSSQNILPTLVLFGIAAIRIIPAISRVIGALQQFRYSMPALEAALSDYSSGKVLEHRRGLDKPTDIAQSELIHSLKLESVSFIYPRQSKFAIRDVTMEIKRGEFIGFAGMSGSGKTTTADILLGLIEPSFGQVLINGESGHEDRDFSIAFVPQEALVLTDTILENIALTATGSILDMKRVENVIRDSDLTALITQLPEGLNTMLGDGNAKLSGGEAQRLNLARAIYSDAQILILDEPTSALDSVTEKIITDTLLRLRGQHTVVMIAHSLHTLQHCDRLYFFKEGSVVSEGSFEDLLYQDQDFRQMVDNLRFHTDNLSS